MSRIFVCNLAAEMTDRKDGTTKLVGRRGLSEVSEKDAYDEASAELHRFGHDNGFRCRVLSECQFSDLTCEAQEQVRAQWAESSPI